MLLFESETCLQTMGISTLIMLFVRTNTASQDDIEHGIGWVTLPRVSRNYCHLTSQYIKLDKNHVRVTLP